MHMKYILAVFWVVFAFAGTAAFGQTANIVRNDIDQAEIDRIVQRFTQNELAFREALTSYVFNRSATIQTVGMGGQISGVYRRDSFMTFTSDGQRFERITFAPISTLTEINVTPADLEDLGGVNPFALEPRMISEYTFTYLGKEKIDDLNLHVFDVTPKRIPSVKSGIRVFSGRVWVDDRDLMIVKSKGKAQPEDKNNKYPVVETWRENVDGKYWFPSYSAADDTLVFGSGQSVRMRMKVTYADYNVGRTDVRIIGEDEMVEDEPAPKPTPRKP